MSEEPTETPPPEEETPEEAPPAPVPAEEEEEDGEEVPAGVEAHLSFGEFVATAALREPRTATATALRSWMDHHGFDANGHYPQGQWQEYLDVMLAST
jgi:hypothetical protein